MKPATISFFMLGAAIGLFILSLVALKDAVAQAKHRERLKAYTAEVERGIKSPEGGWK